MKKVKKQISIKVSDETFRNIKVITECTGYNMTSGIEAAIEKYAKAIIAYSIDVRKIKL